MKQVTVEDKLFDQFKNSILNIDPVSFAESNLVIDGEAFSLSGGYKPFADIYRYICLKAIDPDTLPVILVKGRQVGATVMAAALECYFMACGLYGANNKPPMRVMHLFPTLPLAAAYTKDKLTPIIKHSKASEIQKKNGTFKSFMESRMDTSSPANDNMHFKKFLGGNQVWIEGTGLAGDRLRGRQLCLETELPTPNFGFIKLKDLKLNDELFDEFGNVCIVTKLHPIQESPESYRIIFDDGTEVDACSEHLWLTSTKEEKINKKSSIKNTKEIFNNQKVFNENNHSITVYLPTKHDTFIISVELIDPKPMRCITVDSPSHLYLITRSYIPTHNTVDCIFYDEVQDMSGQAIGAADKIATRSMYGAHNQGVKVLFGTPKSKGGPYYKMWQTSSQQYFHLFCEKCEKHFPLYRPDVNWEDIWLYGFIVRCTFCNHEQDKREAAAKGKWIAINDDPLDPPKMIGYHINQLYIPKFTKETIISQKPENHPTNTERIYMNEVLGEFHDGEGGTITKQEILDNCLENKGFAKIITPSDNIRVYAGFDWGRKADLEIAAGKRQGQSYSCAVILTAHGPELFSVDFAVRLPQNNLEYKTQFVEEMFRRYSVTLAVGDIGDAHDLTEILQTKFGDSFLASRAATQVTDKVKFREDAFPKEIVFEKDYYISELFALLKKGSIKFPKKHYDKVEWLIEHCSSMDIKITQDRAGDPIKRFVKGNKPNDGLMALLNAYLAWKFDVSQKFNIKNPVRHQHEITRTSSGMLPILGHISRV